MIIRITNNAVDTVVEYEIPRAEFLSVSPANLATSYFVPAISHIQEKLEKSEAKE